MRKNLFMEIVTLLRPHQWLKNLFIFLPVFFDKHLGELAYVIPAIVAFIAFCFVASAIYCFNDIYDVESDQLHPKKCKRPIALGTISKSQGYFIMLFMLLMSFTTILLFLPNRQFLTLGIVAFYVLMNIAYCIRLKQIALLDVFIIAFGFVLRIMVGGISANIWISQWIVLMTFLLALFLAFAKRRDDVLIYVETGRKARGNINRYNVEFMNQAISIVSAITIVCYILYTVSSEVMLRMNTPYLYITSIWVLLGILRYLQVTIVDVKSGSPTKVLLKDRFIQCAVLGWISTFLIIIYF